ncbi:MAG: SH3 domain-containing protein, partial [Promethearchaeota archaeon]
IEEEQKRMTRCKMNRPATIIAILFALSILLGMSACRPTTQPPSTSVSYSDLTLLSPVNGAVVIGSANFQWECSRDLDREDWFEVRVWRGRKPRYIAHTKFPAWELVGPPHGFGSYSWQIDIVREEKSNYYCLFEGPTWSFEWISAALTATPTVTPSLTPSYTATPTSTYAPSPIPSPTDTPEPTPTATPTPMPDAVVNVETLNLRSGPGVVYDILGVLKQGDPLKVTGRNLMGDWLKVIAPDGEEGWVAASCLEINVPLAGVAVAQAPPIPTPIPVPAPIAIPIPRAAPALLPAPTLLEPGDAARFLGHRSVRFTWEWSRPLGENEYFSVRIRPEGDPTPPACCHPHTQEAQHRGNLYGCTTGKHYWSVAVARKLDGPDEWEPVSEASEERWFDFFESFEDDDDGPGPEPEP